MLPANVMEVYNRIVQCSQPKIQITTDQKVTQNDSKQVNEVQVSLELGHSAALRHRPTAEGFTHDWVVYVRGSEGRNIQHFVEKVEFHLHETFPRPRRVVREPPYQVAESGYGGFVMPIDVHLRNNGEPKRIRFVYQLFLGVTRNVSHSRCEKISFRNPTPQFYSRLVHGGRLIEDVGVSLSPSTTNDSDISDPTLSDQRDRHQRQRTGSDSLRKLRCVIGPVQDSRNNVADPVECKAEYSTLFNHYTDKSGSHGVNSRSHISTGKSHRNISSPDKLKYRNDDGSCASISQNSYMGGTNANLAKRRTVEGIERPQKPSRITDYEDDDDDEDGDDVRIVGCTWNSQSKRKYTVDKGIRNAIDEKMVADRKVAVKNRHLYQKDYQSTEDLTRIVAQNPTKINSLPEQLYGMPSLSANSTSSGSVVTGSVPATSLVPSLHFQNYPSASSNIFSVKSVGLQGNTKHTTEPPRRGRKKKPVLVEPNFVVVKRKRGRPRKNPIEINPTNKDPDPNNNKEPLRNPLKFPGIPTQDPITDKPRIPHLEKALNDAQRPAHDKNINSVGKELDFERVCRSDESIIKAHRDNLNSFNNAEIDFDSFSREINMASALTSTPIKENIEEKTQPKKKQPKLRIRFKPFVEKFSYDDSAEIVMSSDAVQANINRHTIASTNPVNNKFETKLVDTLLAQRTKEASRNIDLALPANIGFQTSGVGPASHSQTTVLPRGETMRMSRPQTKITMSLKSLSTTTRPNPNTISEKDDAIGVPPYEQRNPASGLLQPSRDPSFHTNSDFSRLHPTGLNRQIRHRDVKKEVIDSGTENRSETAENPLLSKSRRQLSFEKKRKADEMDEDKENQPKRAKLSSSNIRSNYDQGLVKDTDGAHRTNALAKESGSNATGGNQPVAPNGAHVDSLLKLQRQLMSITDMTVLRKVVQMIEETGSYRLNEATFDFDLCNLDAQTVKRLERCLAAVST